MKAEKMVAELREKLGSSASRQLRQSGKVPAVIYGLGQDSVSVALDAGAVETMLRHHARLVDMTVGEAEETVLLKDIDYSPFDEIYHIDFHRIDANKPVSTFVELEFMGTPKGVLSGGILEQHRTDLEIECLPRTIPAKIEVEIGHLDQHDILHASDLKLPEGITLSGDPTHVICDVLPPKKIEEVVEDDAVVPLEGAEPAVSGESSD